MEKALDIGKTSWVVHGMWQDAFHDSQNCPTKLEEVEEIHVILSAEFVYILYWIGLSEVFFV